MKITSDYGHYASNVQNSVMKANSEENIRQDKELYNEYLGQKNSENIAATLSISKTAKVASKYANSLSKLGFSSGNSDTSSEAFKKSVKNFQQVYGLEISGTIDEKTEQKINAAVKVYDSLMATNALINYADKELDYAERVNFSRIAAFMKVGMGLTSNQTAGFMGNIHVESRFSSDNAENKNGEIIDHDPDYIYAVDDGRGYGICQWTWSGRKATLQRIAGDMGVKEGNIIAQLATIKYEMNGEFIDCKNRLMATAGVDDATRIIFSEYGGPNDTSLEARKKLAGEIRYVFNEAGC